MNKRFLFSTKAGFAAESVLKGLAQAHLITATTCVIVCTDDDQVAALLEKLETGELILSADEIPTSAARAIDEPQPTDSQPKTRKPRKPYNGPLVECSKCHQQKAPFNMTKAGICKVCHMRDLKASKKLDHSDPMLETWTNHGPDVECPKCHRPVAPAYMLKDGSMCRSCYKKPGMVTEPKTALPAYPAGQQEWVVENQARPKEKINLDKLSGKRLG